MLGSSPTSSIYLVESIPYSLFNDTSKGLKTFVFYLSTFASRRMTRRPRSSLRGVWLALDLAMCFPLNFAVTSRSVPVELGHHQTRGYFVPAQWALNKRRKIISRVSSTLSWAFRARLRRLLMGLTERETGVIGVVYLHLYLTTAASRLGLLGPWPSDVGQISIIVSQNGH
jgi:hypothetical protein